MALLRKKWWLLFSHFWVWNQNKCLNSNTPKGHLKAGEKTSCVFLNTFRVCFGHKIFPFKKRLKKRFEIIGRCSLKSCSTLLFRVSTYVNVCIHSNPPFSRVSVCMSSLSFFCFSLWSTVLKTTTSYLINFWTAKLNWTLLAPLNPSQHYSFTLYL